MQLLEIQAGESPDGDPLAINVDQIVLVSPNGNGGTAIELINGEEMDVGITYPILCSRLKSLNHA